MIKMRPTSLALATAALLATVHADALEFHGYLRSGFGSAAGAKGSQQCFELPGAYAKYRLGNECETYGEVELDQNLYDGKDGVKFDYHVMFADVLPYANQQDYESLNSNGRDFANRQNWIEAKNLPFLNGATAWVGKRFYQRFDVHINDFYYWDASGYGAGIENLPLGPGKFSYALFRNSADESTSSVPNQRVAETRNDFRYSGVSLGPNAGDLTFGLQINLGDSNVPGQNKGGGAVTVQHFIGNLLGGYNRVAVQYGNGTANNLVFNYPAYGTSTSHKTWRVVEQIQVQPSQDFSAMATMVFQNQIDNYRWISFGVRPVWHITDYFKLQAEYGHDQVTPTGAATRRLDKISIAPTLVAGRGFWARPELRFYVTRAMWNSEARDQWGGVAGGTSGPFGSATKGSSIGFQAEAWF